MIVKEQRNTIRENNLNEASLLLELPRSKLTSKMEKDPSFEADFNRALAGILSGRLRNINKRFFDVKSQGIDTGRKNEIFQNTLETNVFGPLLLAQAIIPIMKANGYGRIVNMASTLGSLTEIASPDSPYHAVLSPAYRLSKTLLNGITVLLAKELRGSNILINSVCPGWVRTDMGGDEAPLTAGHGADTPVWLATLTDDGPTGGFFRERQPIPW